MPGRVFLETSVADLAARLGAVAEPEDDDGPRPDVAPGAELRVLTTGRRLVRMRWGLIPMGRRNARGRPVMETIVNARSETVFDKSAFASVGRAVVPVSGWYEWTGARGRKTRWRIERRDRTPVLLAAITDTWAAPGGQAIAQVATITTDPNADLRAIHDRMGAILAPGEVADWLDGDETVARSLLKPAAEGCLVATEMEDFPRR